MPSENDFPFRPRAAARSRWFLYRWSAACAFVGLLAASPALAQQHWDGTDTSGSADGGNGTWNAANTSWDSAASGGSNQAWTPGGDAVFGGSAGTVVVSGTQSIDDLTFNVSGYTLSSGTLQFDGDGSTIDIGSGLSVVVNSVLTTGSSNAFFKAGGGTLTLGSSNNILDATLNGGLTILASAGALGGSAGNLRFPGTLDLGGFTVTKSSMIVQNGTAQNGTLSSDNLYQFQNATLNAIIAGAGGIRSVGPGTSTLSAPNTYTGTTSVARGVFDITGSITSTVIDITDNNNNGTAGVQVDGASLPDNAVVTISNQGFLRLTGSEVVGRVVSASANALIDLGNSTLTTGDGTAHTFAGVVSGVGGGLTKAGAGSLVLGSAANTATGTLTASAGTLTFSSWSGPVSSSAVLDPAGAVGVGGNLALAAAPSALRMVINNATAGTGYDQLLVTGTVNLGGVVLDTVGSTIASSAGAVILLIVNDGVDPVVGTFNGLAEGASLSVNGQTFNISYQAGDGNDVALLGMSVTDLALAKSDDGSDAVAGSNYGYSLAVTNNGPSVSSGGTVTDTLPAGWTFVSGTGCAATATGFTCSVGALNVSATQTFNVMVAVPDTASAGSVTNNASVAANEPDPTSSNDSDTESTTVVVQTDLAVDKSDDGSDATAGENYSYTLKVTNNGPSVSTGGTLTDTLPSGWTFVSGAGCSGVGTGFTCNVSPLADGAMQSFDVVVAVPEEASAGMATNSATIAANETDPTSSNDTDTEETLVVLETDLALDKSDDGSTVSAGENYVYTLKVTNNGPSASSGGTVTDTLPSGWTFVSGSSCAGNGTGFTCTVGTLADGAMQTFTVTVSVPAGAGAGTVTNSATVAANEPDPNSSNDSDTEDTDVSVETDLELDKSDDGSDATAGENYVYTLKVTNNGPSASTGGTITDTLPAGWTFVSGPGCIGTASGFTCTVGALADAGMESFDVTVAVPASEASGTVTNNAAVVANETDTVSGNDTDSEETDVVTVADLSIDKMDSEDPVVGLSFDYTLEVENLGPSDAASVQAEDTLPAGMAFTGSVDGCTEDAGVVTCDFGLVGAGITVARTFSVEIDPFLGSSLSNTATVSSATADPDSGNDSDTEQSTLDEDPPTITELDTIAASGGGVLDPCEVVRAPVQQLRVRVEDDLSPVVGLDDAANFSLVRAGPDGDFSTSMCGGASGDDIEVPILDVSVVGAGSADVTATLQLTTDPALAAGLYRLAVCESITDEAQNPLDGDGDANPGGNLLIDFRLDPFNLFLNGHFDDCEGGPTLDPWVAAFDPPNQVQVGLVGDDAEGSPRSASVDVSSAQDGTSSLGQCVPLVGPTPFDLRAQIQFDSAGTGVLLGRCELFDAAGCTGSTLSSPSLFTLVEDEGGAWIDFNAELLAPAGTVSALCHFTLEPFSSNQPVFEAGLDGLFVGVVGGNTPIFTDGFESGDLSRWSATVPTRGTP